VSLDQRSAAKLNELFVSFVLSYEWERPRPGEREPGFTKRAVLPAVEGWVAGLRRNSIVVRGDGGVPPTPVSVLESYFYPDVEVSEFEHRLLALEVKFIREGDSSGAISKAIGQSSIYAANGFSYAHALLFECRPGTLSARARVAQQVLSQNSSYFHVCTKARVGH